MAAARNILLSLVVLSPSLLRADDEPTVEQITFFESKVRPVLVEHCYDCHSAESGSAEGKLLLDSRAAIRAGGSRGPAIVPGDAGASWLLTAVSHTDDELRMPPRSQRLPDTIIADLREWIEMGAPDPREGITRADSQWADIDAGREFWSFQPPGDSEPPSVTDTSWARRDLDAFILAALESNGLVPSPDAAPQTLLRRLYFDLVGLPPSPEQIDRFLNSIETVGMQTALEHEVDALLASPEFGERWGRHWLDVARFAESSGKEANISFPYAWRYRDYVIDCFNADLPFDRFLIEQLAGDLLPWEDDAERARLLVATAFLALGTKNLDEMNELQFVADVIDEQIDTVTRAVIGSSVACARCHDHKFDPFMMEDYYALAGIFASTETYFGTEVSPSNRIGGDPLLLPTVDGQVVLHKSIPPERVTELESELAALQQEEEDGRAAVLKAVSNGEDPSGIFTLRDALRIFWRSGAIRGQLEKVDEAGRALPLTMGVLDRDEARDAPLLGAGDIGQPGETIPRGFPRVVQLNDPPEVPPDQSGRLELAMWLTAPDHPLTARVLVNRLWAHLFGAGLVTTIDNFGMSGEMPSHPELLDSLAVRFMANGWHVKHTVREMVLSRTYRQSSAFRADTFERDPENRLLWRVPKRRLEAEAIRDAMLAITGELDLERPQGSLVGRVIGDRPISLIGLDKRLPADLDGSVHRSVYLPVVRDRLPDVLDLFDFAEPSLVTGERATTNVPIQAHYLMNSPFVQDRAAALADRLIREASETEERVNLAFRLCFSRVPDDVEMNRSAAFLNPAEKDVSGDERFALTSFCQALLATAEFRNLD